MSESTGKQQFGSEHEDYGHSLHICVDIGLSALDKLQVPIDNTMTARDLKCKIEILSGIPADLFELEHNGTALTQSLVPVMREFEGLGGVEVLKMKILPIWERFVSTCLKAENSQVRARIRVKMHGVTKEERIFVACFIAARQANSCLLFGILPSNKMIARRVRLSGRNILHAAVAGGNTNCIANILMHGGGKLMTVEDIYSQTPLSMARTLGKGGIVDMLEAYKMVSLRGEGSLKGTNDDDSGYECIITSLEESKHSNELEQDSEEDYELSSDEEEENENQEILPEQNQSGDLDDQSPGFSTACHFLDGFEGRDTTNTSNDVNAGIGGSPEELLIEQIKNDEENGNNRYENKTLYDKESLIRGDNREANKKIKHLTEQSDESRYVGIRHELLDKRCQGESEGSSKAANEINVVKQESEKDEYDEEILNVKASKDNENGKHAKKGKAGLNFLSDMTEKATKKDWMMNEDQEEDVAMATDKCLNNGSIGWISDDSEDSTKRGSHTLNDKMIFNSESQRHTSVLDQDKQGAVVTTGNPIIGIQSKSDKSEGNLLLRRRKKGMPSLIVSRTSSGLSSSFETLNLLDSTGKNFEADSIAVNCEDSNRTDDTQVCAPSIVKRPWVPKPPSKPIPVTNRQQMRRRKFSMGSPTSGSPKFSSRSDMENYLDEAWRRASDSDVNESLSVPLTRPRSYSTPHPPDPSVISKSITSSELKSFKTLNTPETKPSHRRQSVGGWGRRSSISLTFDEWLETKKEQHRRNSLAVQKEKQRRLSLGNQPTLPLSRNINYDQWLAMKTMATERKASHDVTNSCHGNERSREESERAFKTWLQKKDEEALEREQRLLDKAISRKTLK